MFRGRCICNDFPTKAIHQAEIIKKSVFLFWLFIMAIRCEQVHRLELRKFFFIFGMLWQGSKCAESPMYQ